MRIVGGDVLVGEGFEAADLGIDDGRLTLSGGGGRVFDATGLYVLPGAIDIHGDAFERQVMPRPGVTFDPAIAFLDTDRQLIANGITTAYHGLTWSWEGGFRGEAMAHAVLDTLDALGGRLKADTRVHLRHETYNLDAVEVVTGWMDEGRIACLAFNDHMGGTIKDRSRPDKMRKMVERSGLDEAGFLALVERTYARADEVPPAIERLARAAKARGVPMLSHDDPSPDLRAWYRDLGCDIAEFPITVDTAVAAKVAGDAIVFGAPNVVRGGSHTGCPAAAEMVAAGACTVLASDYYYPALALAPFVLADRGAVSLAAAWGLVSSGPAAALGLADRGRIAEGLRADLVFISRPEVAPPEVIATMVAGRFVHLAEADRL